MYAAKEKVYPLQSEQVDNIKKKVWAFVDTVSAFRSEFRERAPFEYAGDADVGAAYRSILAFHARIAEKEAEAAALNQLENLFELQPSKYRALSDCRSVGPDLAGAVPVRVVAARCGTTSTPRSC